MILKKINQFVSILCINPMKSRHTNPEVIMMDYLQELPMGFGMALLQNREATAYFDALSESEQRRIIQKTQSIRSKSEMQIFVDDLNNQ